MNQLLRHFKCVNKDDYIIVPSDIQNLYIFYSKEGYVYSGIRLKRRNQMRTKTYYFICKNHMYKLESHENIFADMPLMSLKELSQYLEEIK
jgi:hypothetical protein